VAEQFTARPFQQVKIARVVDVIAESAFGVTNAVTVAENLFFHAADFETGAAICRAHSGVLELKAVAALEPVHVAQRLNVSDAGEREAGFIDPLQRPASLFG
jgi:hypothetical protein